MRAWCATNGHQPLTVPKFAAELKVLGYDKWKSMRPDALSRLTACGLGGCESVASENRLSGWM